VASVGGSGRRAADTARRAADSRWIERTARVGLAARGLVYVLIDILAFRIAFVDRAERADQKGAFQTLAQNGFGKAVFGSSSSALLAMASGRRPKPHGATGGSGMTANAPPTKLSRPSRR
jgi:Domain of Unknown Function (DUF1206)